MKVRLLKHVLVDGVFLRAGSEHEFDSLPEVVREDTALVGENARAVPALEVETRPLRKKIRWSPKG